MEKDKLIYPPDCDKEPPKVCPGFEDKDEKKYEPDCPEPEKVCAGYENALEKFYEPKCPCRG